MRRLYHPGEKSTEFDDPVVGRRRVVASRMSAMPEMAYFEDSIMAKKKSVSSSKPTTKTEIPVAAFAVTLTPAPARTLTHDEIGLVAGQIWQLLADQGEQSLASVKSKLDAPPDLILAATGWLAREDKLTFKTSGRAVRVSLR